MKLFSFVLSIILCLSLVSCTSKKRNTGEILQELMTAARELPQGEIYVKNAAEGEDGYLSAAMADALYGEAASEYLALTEEYSIYLSSFAKPYEIAVFKCYSSTDAQKIERMCRERANIVSVALRRTEFHSLHENIRIIREGDTVVFLMTDRPDKTERLAKKLI